MANDICSVFLIGRLTREMELSYTSGRTAIGKMSLAVNRRVKKNDQWVDEASFFDVTVFGKQAENLMKWLTKGRQVAVTGTLKQDRWVSKDGKKSSRIAIIADNVQFLGGQSDKTQQNGVPVQPEEAEGFAEEGFDYSEDVPF